MAILSNIPGLADSLKAISLGSRDGSINDDGSIKTTFTELPHDREYRVEITEAKYVHSQAGHEGIRYVLEVTEGDYKGSRVWDNVYFTGHPFQGQRLAVLLASAEANAETIEEAANSIIGGKLVIALKPGSDERYPQTRWINIDQGQKLREGLKPPTGAKTGANPLSATSVDDMIQKRSETPTQAPTAPVTPQVTPNVAEGVAPRLPGGIKLPGT